MQRQFEPTFRECFVTGARGCSATTLFDPQLIAMELRSRRKGA
jgi:hypothetical protein